MVDNEVTVLMTTSPIPSNPETRILDQSVEALRHHLPQAKLLILADGVRPHCVHRTAEYNEYKVRLRRNLYAKQYGNAELIEFSAWTLQAEMIRFALQYINTPFVYINEHDSMLRTDVSINWQAICDVIRDGTANVVRLYYVGKRVLPEHMHMMHGVIEAYGEKFMRTTQYSGWPHMLSTKFLTYMLQKYFILGKRDMLECPVYGPCADSPWDTFKVLIYYPDEDAVRFTHTNGRADANGEQEPADW